MSKTVVLAGTLDTKGEEFLYVKRLIESEGLGTLTVDFGILGDPAFEPDVRKADVVSAGGGSLARLSTGKYKDESMSVVAKGLTTVVRRLYEDGRLDGILGMGGSGGTSVATAAMRSLPVGIPKIMVSTVGGGDVSAYAGTKDISFFPSIVDVAGLNRISRAIFANAAAAIAGMVRLDMPSFSGEKPLLAASMFGNTTTAVNHARSKLEERGYELLIFHCTGTGGKTMESLIAEGHMAGVLDLTTTELADQVCGGVFDAGPDRCMAAANAAVPAVLAPGCVDMANFGSRSGIPKKYKKRNLYQWNPNVTLLRTNVQENERIGRMIAAAANSSTAQVAILLPLRGVSMLDSEGGPFWDPDADSACYEAIKNSARDHVRVIEMDCNINDPEFSGMAAETLLGMLSPASGRPAHSREREGEL